MNTKKQQWNAKQLLLVLFAGMLLLNLYAALALPTSPSITLVSNTTYTSSVTNRSTDTKGTITTVTLSSTQQDYKWKA
ncbi:MAG TPA: hypothetical protein V6C58_07900, partial [Allocoleopsis sp.]